MATDIASALAESLPIAIGIAASPFPIIPAILLLFTPRPTAAGGAFLVGWLFGVAVPTAVCTALATAVELADEPQPWVSWTRVVLGAGLIAAGLAKWVRRGGASGPPAWMESLSQATPGSAGRMGVVLSVANPKVLALSVAGGLAIGAAELPPGPSAGVIVAFTAVASATVALPLVGYLTLGERILPPLSRAKDWLQRNNAAVMAVVLLVIGVVVLVEGISSL